MTKLRVRCPACHITGSIHALTYPGTREVRGYACANRRCKWAMPLVQAVTMTLMAAVMAAQMIGREP